MSSDTMSRSDYFCLESTANDAKKAAERKLKGLEPYTIRISPNGPASDIESCSARKKANPSRPLARQWQQIVYNAKVYSHAIAHHGLPAILRTLMRKSPKRRIALLQEILLRQSLEEIGINSRETKITIDHQNGRNYVNEIEFGIKYPVYFYNEAGLLIPRKKNLDYYFNGNMDAAGKRKEILSAFIWRKGAMVIESNHGRSEVNKGMFNKDYYSGLADSKFGLCPQQANWRGFSWTYRFIECLFTETIPVLFRACPLAEKFVEGFHFVWDDDVKKHKYNADHARENRELAKKLFCFSEEDCQRIRKAINEKNGKSEAHYIMSETPFCYVPQRRGAVLS